MCCYLYELICIHDVAKCAKCISDVHLSSVISCRLKQCRQCLQRLTTLLEHYSCCDCVGTWQTSLAILSVISAQDLRIVRCCDNPISIEAFLFSKSLSSFSLFLRSAAVSLRIISYCKQKSILSYRHLMITLCKASFM